MKQETKDRVWKRYHNDEWEATDPFGRDISQKNFDVDHIYPSSEGESDDIRNLFPMHEQSNREKGDDLEGTIKEQNFKVKKYEVDRKWIGKLYVNGNIVSK